MPSSLQRSLHPSRSVRTPRLAGALLGAVLALAACGEAPPAEPVNVLLVVVDTLRSDALGCYGAPRKTSPYLDALAAEGTRFARAYSTAPWTMPAISSLFTGRFPGSLQNKEVAFGRLPDSAATLAETFREAGYATGGVVSHFLLGERFNYAQGFEEYREDQAQGHEHVSSTNVTRQATRFLREYSQGERPFFLFVHYFDPHYTYVRHPEYGFAPLSAGRLEGGEPIEELRGMLDELTGEEVALLRSIYDEEVRFTDQGIGELLQELEDLELAEDTLVVFVADHGEEFLERGWLGHTRSLYDELVRVPLVLRGPGIEPGRVVLEPVSTVTLAPTLLDLAGVDRSGLAFHGISLAGLLAGAELELPFVFLEVDFDAPGRENRGKRAHKKAIVWNDLKLIRDDTSGLVELYDLGSDPGETTDLAAERPELVRRLLPHLERLIAIASTGEAGATAVELTPEDLDRLRDLGYVDR